MTVFESTWKLSFFLQYKNLYLIQTWIIYNLWHWAWTHQFYVVNTCWIQHIVIPALIFLQKLLVDLKDITQK